jgi:hypothetical protein
MTVTVPDLDNESECWLDEKECYYSPIEPRSAELSPTSANFVTPSSSLRQQIFP